jgi:hypothetical protein
MAQQQGHANLVQLLPAICIALNAAVSNAFAIYSDILECDDAEVLFDELEGLDDATDQLLAVLAFLQSDRQGPRFYVKHRDDSWFQSSVSGAWTAEDYHTHFRMPPSTFNWLLDTLRGDIELQDTPMKAAVPGAKVLDSAPPSAKPIEPRPRQKVTKSENFVAPTRPRLPPCENP